MRVLIKVEIPVAEGNKAAKDGTIAKVVQGFMEKFKPEAAYFVPTNGKRASYFFVDLKDVAGLPELVEPFFINLNASVEVTPAMNALDLKTGLERVANSL